MRSSVGFIQGRLRSPTQRGRHCWASVSEVVSNGQDERRTNELGEAGVGGGPPGRRGRVGHARHRNSLCTQYWLVRDLLIWVFVTNNSGVTRCKEMVQATSKSINDKVFKIDWQQSKNMLSSTWTWDLDLFKISVKLRIFWYPTWLIWRKKVKSLMGIFDFLKSKRTNSPATDQNIKKRIL